jgi:hypothetical protein
VTEPDATKPQKKSRKTPQSDWERKRRLAEVFGDALPDITSDEREPGETSEAATERGDTWLKEQVPPHHGG